MRLVRPGSLVLIAVLSAACDDSFTATGGGTGATTAPGGNGGGTSTSTATSGSGGSTGGTAAGGDTTSSGGTTTTSEGGTTTTTTTTSTTTTITTGNGGSGGATGTVEQDCLFGVPGGCPAGQYCHAEGCVSGTCEPVPIGEMQARLPVCGCDGVTYWNASIAAAHGMSVRASDTCKMLQDVPCGGFASLPCPPNTFCNYRVLDNLACMEAEPTGVCWGMPMQCPDVGIGGKNRQCGQASCSGECDVIKKQMTWYFDNACP